MVVLVWMGDRLIESMIEAIMPIDQKPINEIVDRILAVFQAERVILFGSAASGEMTRNSDIDLLVLDNTHGNTRYTTPLCSSLKA
jgi:predicted nucleotidyltransferase